MVLFWQKCLGHHSGRRDPPLCFGFIRINLLRPAGAGLQWYHLFFSAGAGVPGGSDLPRGQILPPGVAFSAGAATQAGLRYYIFSDI